MSLSQFVRKVAAGCVAVSIPAIALAQSGFSTNGPEYRIAGALPGDQVMPSVSVGAGGGYVVWQDNATDGDGWGISARALDSSLHGVLAPFRVNATGKWDQENAKVALLNNGGAVFVWQGGRQGFQHIYARFLSSSNTWLGLDQMVNTATKVYQANPAVAVLTNGNVVIVYAQYNTNTMQDAYGQIFTPDGVKVGNEFRLNLDFTTFNQRSPAVAAFHEGFLAAWVSEQQRKTASVGDSSVGGSQWHTNSLDGTYLNFETASSLRPSIDIYARLFGADGSPLAAEFLVNSTSNTCANPAVVAMDESTVIFGWSGKDSEVLFNGWDIYARSFTFVGNISMPGVERRVNTQLYGDQIAPRLAGEGENALVVWTSFGQDGSSAGIFGRMLDSAASPVGGEFRANTTTFAAQQEPVAGSDRHGRILTVWTGPTLSADRNDLFSQLYAGSSYTASVNTTNFASPVFVGDPPASEATDIAKGSYTTPYYEAPTLDYPGTIVVGSGSGAPESDAFVQAAGNYSGLFYETAGVSTETAGYVFIKVNKNGSFTGRILVGGRSYSLGSGRFSDLGGIERVVNRRGMTPLVVTLQLDLFGGNQITGTVKSADWTSTLLADKQTSSGDYVGAYTFVATAGRSGPEGSSYGVININKAGVARVVGKLADGSAFAQGCTLSDSGICPLYSTRNGDFVMSWLQFNLASSESPSGGEVVWIKPSQKSRRPYAEGFTNQITAVVQLNQMATPGTREVYLTGGGLNSTDNSIEVGMGNRVTSRSANIRNLNLQGNGMFSGRAVVDGAAVQFHGALLNGGAGEGYFMKDGLSGKVKLDLMTAP